MLHQLPGMIRDIAVLERAHIARAVLSELNAGHTPQLNPDTAQTLTDILSDTWAFEATGSEKPLAAGVVWRLGVAQGMSRVVLRNVANVNTYDTKLLESNAFSQGPDIASDLLKTDPQLLKHISGPDAYAFWRLIGYDPTTPDENNPNPLLSTLYALQHASYIPGGITEQMRWHRDNSSTIRHDPHLGIIAFDGETASGSLHIPSAREQELHEATTRALLGPFIARYTDNPGDRRIAAAAMQDFTNRALTDLPGLVNALQLAHVYDQFAIDRHDWGTAALNSLRQRITNFVPQLDLGNAFLNDLTELAVWSHSYAQKTSDPGVQRLLVTIQAKLEEHETLYAIGGNIHLGNQTEKMDAEALGHIAQAHAAQEGLTGALRTLRGQTLPRPTVESVTHAFETQKFSIDLVRSAFTLVASELDQAKKDALLARFDNAIAAGLARLPIDHELLGPNALKLLGGNEDMGRLAYFPSGQIYLDGRIRSFASLCLIHLTQPEQWLNTQQYPDYVIAMQIETLHDAVWYNRAYYQKLNENTVFTLKEVQDALLSAVDFISARGGSLQPATALTVPKTANSLLAFLRETDLAWQQQAKSIGNPPKQTTPTSPLAQLLSHYKRHQ